MYELRNPDRSYLAFVPMPALASPVRSPHWREVGTRPTGGVVQIPVSPQCILGLSSIGSSSAMLGELPG